MDLLNSPHGDNTLIQVTSKTDSICTPCPHRLGKDCQTEEAIAILDHAHANALDIKAKDTLSWGEAKKRIADKITLDRFHEICQTCSWKKYGICEGVLSEFLD